MPRIAFSSLGIILLCSPVIASADTLDDLLVQLQSALQQLQTFQTNVSGQVLGASTACPNLTRTLSRGMNGGDVKELQEFLISQNLLAPGNDSGYFGALTEAAVQAFQKQRDIVSSGTPATTGYGVVGPRTRDAIASSCSGISTPSASTAIPATVSATAATSAPTRLSTNKTSYDTGEVLLVSWGGMSWHSGDWVGLTLAGKSYGSVVSQGQGKTWAYASAASGNATLTAPPTPGSYEVVYENAGNQELARSAVVSVTLARPSTAITANKSTYAPGTTVLVTWNNPGRTTNLDWVGISVSGSAWGSLPGGNGRTWFYTAGAKTGTNALVAPANAGSYQVEYFRHDSASQEPEVMRSTPFTANASLVGGMLPTNISTFVPMPVSNLTCPSYAGSGPVTATSDGQVIENLSISSNGTPGITVNGHSNVIIRNVAIHHRNGQGIYVYNSNNVTIMNVDIVNDGAPARGTDPNAKDHNIDCGSSSGLQILHARLSDGEDNISLTQCPNTHMQDVEGHNARGAGASGGGFVHANLSPGSILEDFSTVNDPQIAATGDNVNFYNSPNVIVRRGLVDGNNSGLFTDPTTPPYNLPISGGGVVIDNGSHDVLVEDVDILHQIFACYGAYVASGANYNNVANRVGCKGDLTHLIWYQSSVSAPLLTVDTDFTPRAPVHAQYCSGGTIANQDYVTLVTAGNNSGSVVSQGQGKTWAYTGSSLALGATTLTTDKAQYNPGDTIVVSWSNSHSGTATLIAPSIPGNYQIAYYPGTDQAGTGTVLARSITFVVNAPVITLTLDKAQYNPGDTIAIAWANSVTASAQDYVTLVTAGNNSGSVVSQGQGKTWAYTGSARSGILTLIAPATPGGYQITYYPSTDQGGTGPVLARSATFTVAAPASIPLSITTDKSTYTAGATISVTYSNPNTTNVQDWVGITVAGQKYGSVVSQGHGKTWAYTGGGHTGTVTLVAPTTSGNYQIVYYPGTDQAGTGLPLATSGAFTVSQ